MPNVQLPTKKRKSEEEKLAADRVYDSKRRERLFQSSWKNDFHWLRKSCASKMTQMMKIFTLEILHCCKTRLIDC